MADGRIRVLSSVGGERGYLALTSDEEGTRALLADGEDSARFAADGELGEEPLTLAGDADPITVAWSPVGRLLQFEMATGPARVHGVTASVSGPGGPLSGPGVLWDLPAAGSSLLRTAWAAGVKGDLTVLLAMRSDAVDQHGEEVVGAARMIPDAEPYGYVEPLLSTEYDGAGNHVRATLELWVDGDDHPPERGAGLRIAGSSDDGPGGALSAARFGWSIGGNQAIGAYEILRP